jgi:Tol biopolymer transport system component
LIPAGRFPDIARPRFSPRGDQIAFVAAIGPGAPREPLNGGFGPRVALAHGLLWNVRIVGLDGSESRLVADVGADDATVAWSPDETQLFVYGGPGSFIVDLRTGEIGAFRHLAGYGSTSWVPVS